MASEWQAMNCPRCPGVRLRAAMAKQGVEVDYCPSCGGIWLDKGEIFHFTRQRRPLAVALHEAAAKAREGALLSPKTGKPMTELPLFGGEVTLDACPDTGGLWLDKEELRQLLARSEAGFRLAIEEPAPEETATTEDPTRRVTVGDLAAIAAGAKPLPNLVIRSGGVLVLLYALLGAILIACVEFAGLPPGAAVLIGAAIVLLQFALGPLFMDLSLRWLFQCKWVEPGQLPEHLRAFVERVAGQRGIRFPRFGIIEDGAPNAFTYGHHPGNARIVVTRGILELLEPGEVEAVVAHEIGHAVHWDMLVMTLAYLVPLISYYIFRTLISVRVRGRDKSAGARLAIALTSYVVYIISQYLVLWLSRTREYWADRFGGEATGDPNALARALVKIGYGLAGRKSAGASEAGAEGTGAEAPARKHSLEAIGALGIFDPRTARSLAIASASGSGTGPSAIDPENLKGAMRWDLWNPWAKFYELNSTHPLIAKRLDHLGRQAARNGQKPFVVFDQRKPECYWDEFLEDVAVMFLPVLLALAVVWLALAARHHELLALAISAAGLGMLLKTLFSYRGGAFPETTVAGLLRNVKVSAVRGIPCTLKGTVIGRGVPGLIWSEDFVIRDESGIIFLDYRQPFRLWELLFGLLRRGQMQGEQVEAVGWYRRAPVPYVELKSFTCRGKKRRCYVYYVKLFVAALLIAAGIWLFSVL